MGRSVVRCEQNQTRYEIKNSNEKNLNYQKFLFEGVKDLNLRT